MLLACSLMLLDNYYKPFAKVRAQLITLVIPLYLASDALSNTVISVKNYWSSKQQLINDKLQLQQQLITQQSSLLQLANIQAENKRLYGLLEAQNILHISKTSSTNSALVANIIHQDPNHTRLIITIDVGSNDGVYLDQIVLHLGGIFGQIIEVNPFISRVLLLTDIEHNIPVELVRTGEYFIAAGAGKNQLKLMYAPHNSNLVVGDTIISSNLGGRFPAGYYIGTIADVNKPENSQFIDITVQTDIKYKNNQLLLLLFENNKHRAHQPATDPRK